MSYSYGSAESNDQRFHFQDYNYKEGLLYHGNYAWTCDPLDD